MEWRNIDLGEHFNDYQTYSEESLTFLGFADECRAALRFHSGHMDVELTYH